MDYRVILSYVGMISAGTYFAYWRDKKRATEGLWRIPEANLHLLEFLGGWAGAFLAQRFLRHKISKLRYQLTFWLIVLMHELVAFDFLQGWKFSRQTFALIK